MIFNDLTAHVPDELRTDEFVLRAITVDDAARDHAAVMETRDDLLLWEQSTWPKDDFTVEENRQDLVDLERRHAEHRAFTFTVLTPEGTECLGCVYLFPTTATFLAKSTVTPRAGDAWGEVDAVIYFWARTSRRESGLDERLLAALRVWFTDEWAFEKTVYVTHEEFQQQVDLLDRSNLVVKFDLVEPGKPGNYLVFS